MAFRVAEESKQELMSEIDRLLALYNENIKEDEYMFRKNDIIVEALKVGLKQLGKKFE